MPAARQTHCARGHELSADNVVLRKNGARQCRTCFQKSDREAKRRRAQRLAIPAMPRVEKGAKNLTVPWMPLCPVCLGFGFRQVGAGAWTRCQAADCRGGYRFDLLKVLP